MKKTKIFLLMMIAMLWTSMSYAQPSNDDCAGAIDLGSTVGTYTCIQYDVDNATDGTMGSCAFNNQEDVWYKFVAIDDVMVFEYCAKQNVWSERLTLYSGTCGSLTELDCVSAGIGNYTYTGLTAGETYYLLMDMDFD